MPKITIMHARLEDLLRVPHLVQSYVLAGYADGSRPKQRDFVVYSNRERRDIRDAFIWGGPDHIRVAFEKHEG